MFRLDALQYQVRGTVLLDTPALNLPAQSFTALLGPNGAGKSTLMKAMGGDLNLDHAIYLHDQTLANWHPEARARHLAVLPQSSELSFPFLAREVVAIGLTPLTLSRAQGEAEITAVMELTDCAHLAASRYPSLSGGERQRVQLARVLLQLRQAQQPPVLLLDEPTSAQDLGQQHKLLSLIRQLCHQQGLTAVAILHDLNQVLRYCDHCLLLNQGQLVAQGAPHQVLTPDTVETYWHYRPQVHPAHEPQQPDLLF